MCWSRCGWKLRLFSASADWYDRGNRLNTTATIEKGVPGKFFPLSRRQSMAAVFCCTLFGAVAQILIKTGATALTSSSPLAMLTNPPVLLGYSLYGFSTVLLVVALKDQELSILYPVISLTYV